MTTDLAEHATFAGLPFRLQPQSVNWGFTTRTSVTETIGGKVVQVLGVDLGDMTVLGSFGVGGWREQEAFLAKMRWVSTEQVKDYTGTPQRFIVPSRGWDFGVFLKAVSPGTHDASTINLRWSLTLAIVTDNVGLKAVAENIFISRLAQGLGWSVDMFNGGLGVADIQAYLSRHSYTSTVDALEKGYGLTPGIEGSGFATGVPGGTSRPGV